MVLRGHIPEWAGAEVTQPRSESSGWKVTLSSSSCGQLHGVRPLSTAVEKPDYVFFFLTDDIYLEKEE